MTDTPPPEQRERRGDPPWWVYPFLIVPFIFSGYFNVMAFLWLFGGIALIVADETSPAVWCFVASAVTFVVAWRLEWRRQDDDSA
jgi:hypothetical protein